MKASFFTESILYWLVRGIAGASQQLPLPMAVGFGSGLGSAAYHLFGARRALALGNLKAALGDSYTHEEYEAILKKLFQHLGMTLMEAMQLPRMDENYLKRWIIIPPGSRERLERSMSKGNGVILLTAHFGSWELGGVISALAGYPMLVLAREQGWPKLNRLLVRYRESKGCKVVTKGFPIRELIEGLRQQRIVGILADQDGGRNGILSPFFGRLASTAPGAIALGLKTGAPILPVFIVRREGAAHTLILEEPLSIPEEGSLEERVEKGIALTLQVLERYIRQYPHLWLWLHRRWKSSPQRRILLFSDGKSGHDAQAMALRQRLEAAWMKRCQDDKRLKGSRRGLLHASRVQVEFRSPLTRLILTLVASGVWRRFPGGNFWLRWALTPETYRLLQSSSADIGVSCGASTAAVNLLWSWGIRARSVHITRSRLPSWRRFDLNVIPRHDRMPKVSPSNCLVIDGALAPLHPLEDRQLSIWRDHLGVSAEKRIGLLLGGPTRGIPFENEQIQEIVQGLLKSAETLDAQLLVTSSRRTPPAVEEWLHKTLANHPRCRLLVLVNRNDSGNLSSPSEAVPCIFGLSTHLVVSGDSISMVSEAMASGHPVVSFLPKTNGFSFRVPKHIRFLEELQEKGKVVLAAPEKVGEAVLKTVSDTSQLREPLSDTGGDPVVEYLTKWL
jgi:KDO2-lipid IV(A) lauroyltransferase